MPYYHDRYGKLSRLSPIIRQRASLSSQQHKVVGDIIRPATLYVESVDQLENGHVVSWTGLPHMFTGSGLKKTAWTSETGYEYALSRVEMATNNSHCVAGLVLEEAAIPTAKHFTQKGIHTKHTLPDESLYVYRIARDISLGWVMVDENQNELEGVYKRYVNGQLDDTGPYRLQMVSSKTFTIDRTLGASIENEFNELKAKFENLTSV